MPPADPARMIIDYSCHEVELDVRDRQIGPGLHEPARFGEVRGHHAAPARLVAAHLAPEPHQAGRRQAEEVEALGLIGEDEIGMILEVLPDAGQVRDNRDAEPF
jgi:hypothetical protein